jgi:hypothetical protein
VALGGAEELPAAREQVLVSERFKTFRELGDVRQRKCACGPCAFVMRDCIHAGNEMTLGTQGLRTKIAAVAFGDWRSIIYDRLLGAYDRLSPTPGTVASEVGLGFQRSAYWYLSRVEILYGRVMMLWAPNAPVAADTTVYPFDSGGIWHDHHHLTPPLTSAAAKVAYVNTNEMTAETAFDLFPAWIREAFPFSMSYVIGDAPPTYTVHDGVDLLPGANHGTAWSWELRIPCASLPDSHMRLVKIIWPEDDYLHFKDYLHNVVAWPSLDTFRAVFQLLTVLSEVRSTVTESAQVARHVVIQDLESSL